MADRRAQSISVGNRADMARIGRHARGFSFTEILFAVVVLGIGFIMVAAIFPVAIQQGKLTTEQGTATGVAREALGYLAQVGANSDAIPNSQGGPLFPATGMKGSSAPYLGMVYSFRDPQPAGMGTGTLSQGSIALSTSIEPSNDSLIATSVSNRQLDELWYRLNLSLVVPTDQRYAFVGLYRRNGDPSDRRTWSPFAQVWFIPVTTRSRSIYSPGTNNSPGVDINPALASGYVAGNPALAQVNLQARLVKVSIDADPYGSYPNVSSGHYNLTHYILYNWSGTATQYGGYEPASLSENCYIIIANDQINFPIISPATTSENAGRMNGHVYHVGSRRPDLDSSQGSNSVQAYDLAPDGDFVPDVGNDGYFETTLSRTDPSFDDIFTIGQARNTNYGAPVNPWVWASGYGNASAPADAYVISLDDSPGADAGTSQDISAFTTFIKVN